MKNVGIGFFILVLISFSFFSFFYIDSNLIYFKNLYTGIALTNRFAATFLYILFIIVLFALYLWFITKYREKKLFSKDVKNIIIAASLILLPSYPAMLSFDIFNYIATAKVLFFYHENPYIIMPIEFVGDKLLLFTHAANKIALYGPVWTVLSGLPHAMGLGNFILTLYAFKLFTLAFYIGTFVMLYKISRDWYRVVLFALNPLVLIETLVSSHNDIIMMFFALCAFYFLSKKKILFACLFIFLSILIKYATLFLLPVFIYTLVKTLQKKTINWEKVYFFAALSMFLIFLLSPIREEIYPWYGQWFLPFIALLPKKKWLVGFGIAISSGLLLRYLPYMYFGTYSHPTPFIKMVVTIVPLMVLLLFFVLYYALKKKI